MIGYLRGKVLSFSDGIVILENNGVGFEINCSLAVYQSLVKDMAGEVYTYMSVKEDGISLYGFLSQEEKSMFLKLITVSGVGPKMAITVLSNMSLNELIVKITTADVKGLSQVKGLGKKTAERIVLELREKIGSIDKNTGEILFTTPKNEEILPVNQDALEALIGFGFTKSECIKVLKEGAESGETSAEKLVAYALKHIK